MVPYFSAKITDWVKFGFFGNFPYLHTYKSYTIAGSVIRIDLHGPEFESLWSLSAYLAYLNKLWISSGDDSSGWVSVTSSKEREHF